MMRSRIAVALASCLALSAGAGFGSPAFASRSTTTPTTTIALSDTATMGMPASIAAGWHRFTAVQKSKDGRQFSVGRLKSGVTVAELYKLSKASNGDGPAATKALIDLLASIVIQGGVDTTKTNRSSHLTYETDLTPGSYVTANLPSDNGRPVFTPFTVVAGSAGNKPRTSGTVTVSDFKFGLQGLHAGTATVDFHNPSTQTHEIQIERIDPGTTEAQVLQALQGQGQPKFAHDDGFYGLLSPKQSMVAQLTLAPHAMYLFVCFLPDSTMPKMYMPHAAEGMYKFLITK